MASNSSCIIIFRRYITDTLYSQKVGLAPANRTRVLYLGYVLNATEITKTIFKGIMVRFQRTGLGRVYGR